MSAPVVSAILAAGGLGSRLAAGQPKQFLSVGGVSILERSLRVLATHPSIHEVIVALPAEHLQPPPSCVSAAWPCPVRAVAGGSRRQDSVARAFAAVSPSTTVVLVHDAARPFVTADLISRMIDAVSPGGAAIPAIPVADTVKQATVEDGVPWITATLPRASLHLAQTPQAFARSVLATALASPSAGDDATDEAGLVERSGGRVRIVAGDPWNVKITTPDDLRDARHRLEAPATGLRIGTGYDLHRLVEGRPLVLAGVRIPHDRGLHGHSDADIVCHAVTDAILGAAALGDIGRLFPDSDPAFEDADSVRLLREAAARVHEAGHAVANVDVTVIAERPKLLPYLSEMRARLAEALGVDVSAVSIKGKTNESVDSMGRGESMACHAVALLTSVDSEPRRPGPRPRP